MNYNAYIIHCQLYAGPKTEEKVPVIYVHFYCSIHFLINYIHSKMYNKPFETNK